MSVINEILFPVSLFIVYFVFAAQFIMPAASIAIVEPVAVEASSDSGYALIPTIEREWLETQSLANLKAIASELAISIIGDKRSKINWINEIAAASPTTTVLTLDPCLFIVGEINLC
jgi:hypothetical protein